MSTLELADNAFQLCVFVGILLRIAYMNAIKHRQGQKMPFSLQLLACTVTCGFAGTLFWLFYFLIYADFPYYFSPAELCYLGFYLGMIGLCLYFTQTHQLAKTTHRPPWWLLLFPLAVFGATMVCFVLVGGLLWNLYYGIPLSILAYHASRGFFWAQQHQTLRNLRIFYGAVICYLIFCNTMFIVSCYGFNNLYLFFDSLSTLSVAGMFYGIERQVADELH